MLNRIVLSCFKIPNRNFRCFRIERWFPVLAIDSDGLRESFRACDLQAVSHQFTSTQGISTDVARLVLIYRHSSTCNCNHCDLPKVNKPKLTRIDLSTFAKLLSAHLTAKHYLLSRLLFGDKTVCNRFKKINFKLHQSVRAKWRGATGCSRGSRLPGRTSLREALGEHRQLPADHRATSVINNNLGVYSLRGRDSESEVDRKWRVRRKQKDRNGKWWEYDKCKVISFNKWELGKAYKRDGLSLIRLSNLAA